MTRLAWPPSCVAVPSLRFFHEDSKLWDLRAIVNAYQNFTYDLTRSKVRYKSFLRSLGIFLQGSSVYSDQDLLKQIKKEHDHFVAVNMFEHIRSQQEIKNSFEKRLEKTAKQWTVISNLCSIPGISHIRACIITAIVCWPERFLNKHKFWAYSMLVRHIEESDGKVYGRKKIRGRAELKAVFMGAATSVLMNTSGLRRYYDELRGKGTSDCDAKKAVARRIAAITLTIMKSGCRYDDKHEKIWKRLENVTPLQSS